MHPHFFFFFFFFLKCHSSTFSSRIHFFLFWRKKHWAQKAVSLKLVEWTALQLHAALHTCVWNVIKNVSFPLLKRGAWLLHFGVLSTELELSVVCVRSVGSTCETNSPQAFCPSLIIYFLQTITKKIKQKLAYEPKNQRGSARLYKNLPWTAESSAFLVVQPECLWKSGTL